MQRLLADRQLGDARDQHHLPGNHPGLAVDHDDDTDDASGSGVGAQRRGNPRYQHDQQSRLCAGHNPRRQRDGPRRCHSSRRTPPGSGTPPGEGTAPAANGTAFFTTTPRSAARTVARFGTGVCVDDNFRAAVSGLAIRGVTFFFDGRATRTVSRPPFTFVVRSRGGIHRLRARVSFTDGTPIRTINFRFRVCAQSARFVPPVTG